MEVVVRSFRARLLATTLAIAAAVAGDPARAIISSPYDSSSGFTAPQVINDLVGANIFYDAGYLGTHVVIANVEAGHVWSGHDVFDRSFFGLPNAPSVLVNAARDPVTAPDLGDIDYHATMVGNVLAGTADDGAGNLSLFGAGMAPLATLWSGAIATSFDHTPENIGSFEISDESFLTPYRAFFEGSVGGKADVINSSWGFADPAATSKENRILDALSAANPTVTFVRAAGNEGPTVAPGTGFNGITVGSLGGATDAMPFRRPSDFSSGAAADFYNPATEVTLTGVRTAVSIAAPGEDFALAAYLGKTGSLAEYWDTANPATDLFFVESSGTSFASPVVAGGVALLKDVSYGGVYLVGQSEARDTRVIKSVLMAAAAETAGWDNGLHEVDGELITTQSLDAKVGAGAMDLANAAAIYVGGTTDVAGLGGGVIALEGWDIGAVAKGGANSYLFDLSFEGPVLLTVSLNWFVNETFDALNLIPLSGSFANLDLSVWTVVDGVFVERVASSESLYNNSEFLRFGLGVGTYGLRVTFDDVIYDLPGTLTSETYGLAWTVTAVPEPGEWGAALGAVLLVIVLARRRRLSNRRRAS
jgi:hypothetical protein